MKSSKYMIVILLFVFASVGCSGITYKGKAPREHESIIIGKYERWDGESRGKWKDSRELSARACVFSLDEQWFKVEKKEGYFSIRFQDPDTSGTTPMALYVRCNKNAGNIVFADDREIAKFPFKYKPGTIYVLSFRKLYSDHWQTSAITKQEVDTKGEHNEEILEHFRSQYKNFPRDWNIEYENP